MKTRWAGIPIRFVESGNCPTASVKAHGCSGTVDVDDTTGPAAVIVALTPVASRTNTHRSADYPQGQRSDKCGRLGVCNSSCLPPGRPSLCLFCGCLRLLWTCAPPPCAALQTGLDLWESTERNGQSHHPLRQHRSRR